MRAHLQETIGKARQAQAETLEVYVARAAGLEGAAVRPTVDRVMAIVEGIPGLLESVSEAAMTRRSANLEAATKARVGFVMSSRQSVSTEPAVSRSNSA